MKPIDRDAQLLKPLFLRATNHIELNVISSLVQDSVLKKKTLDGLKRDIGFVYSLVDFDGS